jgi:hypothetical protein
MSADQFYRNPPAAPADYVVPMTNQVAHAQAAPYGGAKPNVSPAPHPSQPAPVKHPCPDLVPAGVTR